MRIYKGEGAAPVIDVQLPPFGGQRYGDAGADARGDGGLVVVHTNVAAREDPGLYLVAHTTRLDHDRLPAPKRVGDADDGLERVPLGASRRRAVGGLVRGLGVVVDDAPNSVGRDAARAIGDGKRCVGTLHPGFDAHLWRNADRLAGVERVVYQLLQNDGGELVPRLARHLL